MFNFVPGVPPSCRAALGAAAAACCAVLHTQVAASPATSSATQTVGTEFSGDLRAHTDLRRLNAQGPLARAQALSPGIFTPAANTAVLDLELRGSLRTPRSVPLAPSLSANLLFSAQHADTGAMGTSVRSNELYASFDSGAWQASAGKKLVGWDVGYGFRPNDVVQQETRRTLLGATQEGRPLLQMEHFDAERALSLVWVNPQHLNSPADEQRWARESALAARGYQRAGAADWHVFGRIGKHTGASAGAAVAWVATAALAVHASGRVLQRHDAWRMQPLAGNEEVASRNPWNPGTQGGTRQALVGGSWTGQAQQSVILEVWHDGTAPAASTWRSWTGRNAALATLGAEPGLPAAVATAAAGNLAWQATPMGTANLHRNSVFLRFSWQPQAWTLSVDTLYHPADQGRVHTTSLAWQGDRVRVEGAWRVMAGPADAVLRQLPQRQTAVLAATLSF